MLDSSLFVSDTIHPMEVEVANEQKVILHFRELPAVEFIKFHSAIKQADEVTRAQAAARLIVASLCEPDGSTALTMEQALRLKTKPLDAIFSAVLEVNGGNKPGKL